MVINDNDDDLMGKISLENGTLVSTKSNKAMCTYFCTTEKRTKVKA